jgi:segregation and condensation protein A
MLYNQESSKILVKGELLTQLPEDLYIPPQALEVFLETFEGPLDLLLYLIKRQNIDILDIPIAKVTDQYMEYIDLMQQLQLELAGEYLVIAATLAEIKSRLLLPCRGAEVGEEEDPRAELIRQLQEYEQYKLAASSLDALPRQERDVFAIHVDISQTDIKQPEPEIDFQKLLNAFNKILQKENLKQKYHIYRNVLSVQERMTSILTLLQSEQFVPFHACFTHAEGRGGMVVTFIAILELFKGSAIEVIQSKPFAPIYIKALEHGS